MADIIQLRRDTAANWTSVDPILADGEMGLEKDTGQYKLGNGVDLWSLLSYGGTAGAGFPAGGTADQVLAKVNSVDYNTTWKDLKTLESVSTTPVTVTLGSEDHSVFVDTDTVGSIVALTINDPSSQNDRLSVIADGAFDVALTITGLTAEVVPAGEARSYVWSGTAFVLASGGGGGGGDLLAEIQVPQPKTWVEKFKDYTNTSGILNQWGDGVYLFTLIQDTTTRSLSTILSINMADTTATGNIGSMDGRTTDDVRVQYDIASNTFNVAVVAGNYYIAEISRWEDDPDNLPLQTIPSDPSLIKDWVEKYSDDGTLAATSIPNTWGTGKYLVYVDATGTLGGASFVFDIKVIGDVITMRTNSGAADSLTAQVSASNNFIASVLGSLWSSPYISRISRWEDVAGADAQMSVPVDGWELIYEDWNNIDSVTNQWGAGYYKAVFSAVTDPTTGGTNTSLIQIDANSIGNTLRGSYSPLSTDPAQGYCLTLGGSNVFTATQLGAPTERFIKQIHKFNSLVNVLHSYVPDPRSVAQKDWVDKYENWSNTGDVTNSWGEGMYEVTFAAGASGDPFQYANGKVFIYVGGFSADTQETLMNSASTGYEIFHRSAGYFQIALIGTPTTRYIKKIRKYEDSQASDAPRTVLEDGWELVYDVPGNTSTIPNIWGSGIFKAEVWDDLDTSLYYAELNVTYGSGVTHNSVLNVDSGANRILFRNNASDVFNLLNSGITGNYDIQKLWKFTGLLRIDSQVVTNTSEGSNITNAVIDTDAGDVDCTSYFADTTQDRVVKLTNDGTNGNHLTNCPNSIEIGDGKTVQFYYNLGWRYEDVIIDEYVSSGQTVTKWGGGRMEIRSNPSSPSGGANPETITFAVPFIDSSYSIVGTVTGTVNPRILVVSAVTPASFNGYRFSDIGSATTNAFKYVCTGRWKTGV